MDTIETKIYSHDSDVDATHKTNTNELNSWINHLKYIHNELDNLMNLCSHGLKDKFNDSTILSKFEKKNEENDTLLNVFNNYLRSRESIAECEDTQCDMVYITEHETYRQSYLYHLNKYRNLKDIFYSTIRA